MQIKLTFLGATQNVTGSQYLIEFNDTRFLVDCGLYQERKFKVRNWAPFNFSPDGLDAVILTHAHLDHCGLLPKLVREGFNCPIYCTAATAEIARIILLDSAKIQEEDAEFKKRRHEREGRRGPYPEIPLYTTDDAAASLPLFSPLKYKESVAISENVEVTFYDAGHVFGSSMVKVKVRHNGEERTIIFSGDVGGWDRPIVRNPSLFEDADYVVVESTYGDRVLNSPEDSAGELAETINATVAAGGNIVIPSFALERSQEIMYYLNELLLKNKIPQLMVFVDSPMAVSITGVFQSYPELYDAEMTELMRRNKSPFSFPGLKLVRTVDESKAIKEIAGSIIVIAGSGMCTGGRIKHHLVTNISREDSTILFVGYQAIGTLGRQIVEGKKSVRILGQHHRVKARIAQLNGFSAHADRDELIEWLSGLKKPPRRVFVTHGESSSARYFSSFIKEKTGWKTRVPEYRHEAFLD